MKHFFTTIFIVFACFLQAQEYYKPVKANPELDTMISVNGAKLHLRIHGEKPVGVVFINGFGASQNYWNHLIPDLVHQMGVLTYDRAGYAESEPGVQDIDIETTARDLDVLLNKMNINHPVILVAHSYGGMVARRFIQLYPQKASGLVLIDSSHERTKTRTLEVITGDDLALFKRFLNGPAMKFKYKGMDLEKKNMQRSEQMLIDNPELPILPCVVLTAGERPAYNGFTDAGKEALQKLDNELQKELGTRIPGSKHIIVKGGVHNLHISHPEVVKEAILTLIPRFVKSAWVDSTWTMDVELGDIDADGDLDALVANMRLKPFTFWINDGKGNFSKTKQEFPVSCHGVALSDFDNDEDLDALIIPNAREANALQLWLNNGRGEFTKTGQAFGKYNRGLDAEVADFDQDGDLDVHVQYYQNPGEYLINDGKGHFSSAETAPQLAQNPKERILELMGDQTVDSLIGYQRALYFDYDLDGDDDLLVKREGEGAKVYQNNGSIPYEKTDFVIPAGMESRVVIPVSGDVNNDGYPDLLFLIQNEANQIWINNQRGGFYDSGNRLDASIFAVRAKFGDLDNDGDQDIFIVSGPKRGEKGLIICPNQIWFNALK